MAKGYKYPTKDGLKYCPQCELTKPMSDFYLSKGGYGVRSPCKACIKRNAKKDYETKYKGYMNKDRLADKNDLKKKIVADLGGKCQRCGYNEFMSGIDFHHVSNDDKQGNIADLLFYSIRNERRTKQLMVEIAKCILLCRNCHCALHAGEWSL